MEGTLLHYLRNLFVIHSIHYLVTQPMLQRRPNRTELRLMESYISAYIQILCLFQKSKQNVSPPSLPCSTKKFPFTPDSACCDA